MKHALLSPSASHRWLNCPGSVEANANRPWEMSSFALEGTTAHALLEVCQRLGAQPDEFLGKVLEAGLMPVEESMLDPVGYAMDYISGYMADNPKAKIFIEHPVYPGELFGLDDKYTLWGTPDIRISNYPAESVILDYKHGIGIPVSVKDNSQTKTYQVGQRAQFGRYQRYRDVIIQPRAPKRRPVQEHTYTDAELMKWVGTAKKVIPIALSTGAPRNAGAWCKYCAASGNCVAQLKASFDDAAREFKNPKSLTPAQLASYMDKVPMVKEALESFLNIATTAIHAGVKVPGYVPSWTNSHRQWTDEEKANKMLTKFGLETKERYTVKLLTPAAAEKVLVEKGKIKRRKRGETYDSPLEDYVSYGESKPTIKKE